MALGTLELLHVRIAFHADVGLVFVGPMVVHLVQRRRTLVRMAGQLARVGRVAGSRVRRTVSDLLLLLLLLLLLVVVLYVLVSGVLDWSRGTPAGLPLPEPFRRWHLDAGIVLVLYLVVHVGHRRGRLRGSTIR